MTELKTPQTSEADLDKMNYIYEGHKKRRKALGRQLKKATTRLKGATREVLKRRFLFDIKQLYKQLEDVAGKELWAKRMVQNMNINLSTNEKGNLIHKPLAALKMFKL